MKKNERNIEKHKKQKGITLIALVITVIILLILAGVTLSTALGQNGLFQKAKLSGEKYKQAEENESQRLDEYSSEMDKIINGTEGSGGTEPQDTPEVGIPKTVADAIKEDYTFTENKEIQDELGNSMTIPAGFRIVPNGEDEVEYNYTKKEDKIPTVQDGIVIEDEEENQFVWIPVGTIKNKEDDEKNEETTNIILARYEFDSSGTPTPHQNGNELIKSNYIEETEAEHNSSQYRNSIAKNIEEFKSSAQINHGYYIARYEASYGAKNKPLSKQSTSAEDTVPIVEGQLWNNITQMDASAKSKAMYEQNSNFESDLINSYAWDTAIVFIQEYSEISNYSIQEPRNKSLGNTGKRDDNTTDKVCNIYDMAGNIVEWTTETNQFTSYPFVYRGGYGSYGRVREQS